MSFIEYLISNGYKPYRKVYDRSKRVWEYIQDDNINYFSSIVSGYADIRLIKDDKEVIYGLHQYKHHPILIYPRPSEIINDEQMDRFFMNNTYDQIFNKLNL